MGNASILFIFIISYKILLTGDNVMIKVNIEELLKQNKRSKYWLCQRMNITSRNLNRIIRGETTSISFKYIEQICILLNCTPGDLFTLMVDEEDKLEV